MPPRIAFSTLAFPDATLAAAVSLGRRWGYAGIELRLIDGELIDPSMPATRRAQVSRTLDGLPVVAIDSSIRLTGPDPGPELRRFLQLASDWHSPLVRVFGGDLGPPPLRQRQLRAAARVLEDAAPLAARLGVAIGVEPDLDALLARPDVDVVCVCVPSGLHAEIGIRAARAGKHLAVEKPVDVTLAAADRLIEAARTAGVALTVISQHRFDPGLIELKRLIDEGALGRLVLGEASTKWYRTQEYYDSAAWRGTWAMDGGSLLNQGVHYVDLLRWCMGPVTEVTAVCATQAHQVEVEDTALAVVRFGSGAVGTIVSTTAAYPGFPQRLEITGTGGTVIVEDGRIARRALAGEAAAHSGQPGAGPGAAADPAAIEVASHAAQLADLLAAVAEGREPAVSGQAGRGTLEVVCAVYQSARTGATVRLPAA